MEDRYLFKAKRIDNGEWVTGYLIIIGKINYYICSGKLKTASIDTAQLIPQMYKVDEYTLCQCTGLKDKNGKLIWEGDIVKYQFDNDDCTFPNKDTKKRIGMVFFSNYRASWSIAMGRKGCKNINNDLFNYAQNGNRVEVIGNKFDIPESLESEE